MYLHAVSFLVVDAAFDRSLVFFRHNPHFPKAWAQR